MNEPTEQTAGKCQVRRVRCVIFSRVVGYYAPLDNWHEGKRAEFRDRRVYAVPSVAQLETMGAKESGQ